MESEVALLESRMRRETEQLRAAVRDALDVQVLFRTDEDTLPDETRQRLVRLAGTLAGLDDMLVRIKGYPIPAVKPITTRCFRRSVRPRSWRH